MLGHHCRHNFCWQCLAGFSPKDEHTADCPHARPNIANDPRNWAPENLNMAQMDNLIAAAANRLDNNQVPWGNALGVNLMQMVRISDMINELANFVANWTHANDRE